MQMNSLKKIIVAVLCLASVSVLAADSDHHVIEVNGLAERTIEPNMVSQFCKKSPRTTGLAIYKFQKIFRKI
jgi:hypothetical protein